MLAGAAPRHSVHCGAGRPVLARRSRRAGLPPGGWLFPLVLLVSVVASGEMLWMFATRPADERPLAWLVYVGNLAIVGSNAVPLFCPAAEIGVGRSGGSAGRWRRLSARC